MITLRKSVEQVVRPIRASGRRKNQMREELLAHLEGLLVEEQAREGDDAAAVGRALARFGAPGQLTAELQATVPRWEQWAFTPLPGLQRFRRHPGELLNAYLRRTIGQMTVSVLGWGGFVVGCNLAAPRRIDVTGIVLALASVYLLLVGFLLLAEAIRRNLVRIQAADGPSRRNTWLAVASEVLAAAVLSGGVAASVLLLMESAARVPLISPAMFWGVTLVSALAMLPLLAAQVYSSAAQIRQFDRWDGLELSLDS